MVGSLLVARSVGQSQGELPSHLPDAPIHCVMVGII